MRTEDAVTFLNVHGAAEIAHPGGTLLEHLLRVADVLQAWGNTETVILAGLAMPRTGPTGSLPRFSPPTVGTRYVLR